MKICFVVGAFPLMKCGVGDYCKKIAEELTKKGNEVYIITSKKASNKSNILNIYNIIEKWDNSAIQKILDKLQEIKPDIVNIQYPSDEYKNNLSMNILPIKIKKIIKCKVTATIHEYECFTWKRRIRNYLNFKNLDKIIVVEKEFIDLIKKDFKKKDIVHIPISSNIPRSKLTNEGKEELLKKYGLLNKKVISYFGFSVPSKGIEYLLNCVAKLNDTVILFINQLDPNNEYHKSLLELIDKLNIKEKVIITGFLDDENAVADLLSISNVCVLPFTEGVKTRNGSFLAAYNQQIPIITTSTKENDKNRNILRKTKR